MSQTEQATEEAKPFQVLAMSEEFFQLTQDMPELSAAPYVVNGTTRIEGAKLAYRASSFAEIESKLPEIVKQIEEGQRLVVVHYAGTVGGIGMGSRYVLDLSKIPAI